MSNRPCSASFATSMVLGKLMQLLIEGLGMAPAGEMSAERQRVHSQDHHRGRS